MLDKTYRPAEVETKRYALWEDSGAFAADVKSSRPAYTIMMPPPNVTGGLHMGHALNFTLQDILVRFMRMKGRDVLWQPGTDHAGIATQMLVERRLEQTGTSRHALGRDAFVETVWRWKAESGDTITRQSRRLGASPDWARERFTMDQGLSVAVRKVFVDLYKQGLIYRDRRLVNWDPKLKTAISDLEVAQRQLNGHLWHFKYPIEGIENKHITVATTRPETMLGDTAVAVHPEDGRYKHLVGKHCILPLVGRRLPVVADEHVDPEQGSGAVKITPAHDFNDFEIGRRHGLEMVNILDRHACIAFQGNAAFQRGVPQSKDLTETLRTLGGLDRYEARERIVSMMEQRNLVEKVEPYTHMVPHGDRSGVAIEPWLTTQWYVNAARLAGPAIRAVEEGRTRFVPKNWSKTYFEWMHNIQPWCVSRQLWWGHRIPAWYGRKALPPEEGGPDAWSSIEDDPEMFVAASEAEAIELARQKYGCEIRVLPSPPEGELDPVFQQIIDDRLPGEPGWEPIWRDGDVLDTWLSSALWPFSTLGWPDETPELARYYPSDVLVTGFDIIFFWVARMMMMGLYFMGEVPFSTVYIHALVRDEHGQKMSKSKGNIIDPLELIDRYGCDALRFTLAALSAQGRDIKLSESRVEGMRNFATKLWNAARYCRMNECAPDPAFDPRECKLTLNRWIVHKVIELERRVRAALEAYKFNDAASVLYQFIWATFCDWYLEFTKPVLGGERESWKAETRAATAWAFDQILLLLHPIMPFITEELWAQMSASRATPLISAAWPDYARIRRKLGRKPSAANEMDWVVRLISEVRSTRTELNVPPAARVTLLHQGLNSEHRTWLEGDGERRVGHAPQVAALARLERIAALEGDPPEGSAEIVMGASTFFLPLADVIDVKREKARLEKEIEKMAREIGKLDSKLANKSFRAKAPADVVEANRERRAEAKQTRAKLEEALGRLVGR